MAIPSVTYTFANSTTADATQVNQNFTDLINSLTDGSKSLSIAALTAAGAATLQGAVTLGDGSPDDITVNGSLASSVPIKTNNSFDIGSATLGLAGLYLGSAGGFTTRVIGGATASWTMTLPTGPGTNKYLLSTNGSGVTSWVDRLVKPTVQKFTSGSGTYTTPANVLYLRVTMVGAGGGGGAAQSGGGGSGGAGGDTTFGDATASGGGGAGGGGGGGAGGGGAGGSATLGTGMSGIAITGGSGTNGYGVGTTQFVGNHPGGSSILGGGSGIGTAGTNSGGGGKSSDGSSGNNSGGSGGAGGGIIALITTPSATYSYAVGAAGSAGAGAGAGAAGVIMVEEYYQ